LGKAVSRSAATARLAPTLCIFAKRFLNCFGLLLVCVNKRIDKRHEPGLFLSWEGNDSVSNLDVF